MSAIIAAPCDQIRPGNNDRKDFDRAELERLAASIEVDGLLQRSVGMFDADEFWTLADDCAAKTKKVAPVLAANDLMDTGEVAAMLGTTAHKLKDMRARIERYRKLDGMPEPLRLVGGRPVWLRADIDRWLAGEGKPAVRYCPACSHLEASHVRRDGARFCTADGGCACFKREAS